MSGPGPMRLWWSSWGCCGRAVGIRVPADHTCRPDRLVRGATCPSATPRRPPPSWWSPDLGLEKPEIIVDGGMVGGDDLGSHVGGSEGPQTETACCCQLLTEPRVAVSTETAMRTPLAGRPSSIIKLFDPPLMIIPENPVTEPVRNSGVVGVEGHATAL